MPSPVSVASRLYPLERYFRTHAEPGIKTKIAKKAKTSLAKISDLIAGRLRRPSPELAKRFQDATGGEVTALELLYFRPAPKRKHRVKRKTKKAA